MPSAGTTQGNGRLNTVGVIEMQLNWLLIASFLMCVPVQAEEKSGDAVDYQAVLSMLTELVGGSVNTKTESGQRVVSITVDRSTVNRDFEKLQALKLLNPDISQTFIATHQNPAGLAIANQLAVMAVIVEYRTQKTDKCAFVAYFLVPDDYGHQQKIPLFAFGFDRALYNRINWDNFDNTNLSKVAHGYKLSSWATAHILD
jgi:hypothetical protein